MPTKITNEELDAELLEYTSNRELVRRVERLTSRNVSKLIDEIGEDDAIEILTVELDRDLVPLFWLDGEVDDDPYNLIPDELSGRSTAEMVVDLVSSWR